MKELFYNTSSILNFIIRRERIRQLIWILAFSLSLIGFVPVFESILSTSSNMQVLIDTMKNPVMIAFIGPVFVENHYTVGSMYSNYMLLFSVMIIAVMNIFLIASHTRSDEEKGRLELLRSLSVGRFSNMVAVLIIAIVSNLLIGTITALGFHFILPESMTVIGSFIFGMSLFAIGTLFAGITLLFSQITVSNRTAIALSFFTLFFFYMLRGVGDLYAEVLSLISPLGLILKTENFVNDYFYPIWIILIESGILIALSFAISKNRDLGSGLIPEKSGRRNASVFLRGMGSFSFRLLKTPIIIWTIVIFTFAGMYASVFGDLEGYLESSEMIRDMLVIGGDFSLTDQFISLLMTIMSMIGTIPVLVFINRAVSEEKENLTEEILSKSVSRYKYLGSFFAIALIMAIIFQVTTAVGLQVVGKYFLETIPSLETFLISSLVYLPAIFIMIAISTLLIGLLPKFTWLNYVYLGYTFVAVYFGRLLDLPEIMGKITPFGHIPSYPLEELEFSKIFILLGIFVALSVLGFLGYRKRDLL